MYLLSIFGMGRIIHYCDELPKECQGVHPKNSSFDYAQDCNPPAPLGTVAPRHGSGLWPDENSPLSFDFGRVLLSK